MTGLRAHLLGALEMSLSADKQTAMIVFEIAGEEGAQNGRLAVTLPTQQIKWLRSLVHDLNVKAEREGAPPGAVMIHQPSRYDIGSSEQLRGMVVIEFDKGTPSEITYAFPNLSGLQFAEGIKKDIMPRLTMDERKQMILPKGPGLILPS